MAMQNAWTLNTHSTRSDERFLDEWFEFGMTELNAYLNKHARFADFCARRDSDA
jgi:hypothetical protein